MKVESFKVIQQHGGELTRFWSGARFVRERKGLRRQAERDTGLRRVELEEPFGILVDRQWGWMKDNRLMRGHALVKLPLGGAWVPFPVISSIRWTKG